jgi:hypothetical protein
MGVWHVPTAFTMAAVTAATITQFCSRTMTIMNADILNYFCGADFITPCGVSTEFKTEEIQH